MKLALWFFPLHYTSGVTTENFSHLALCGMPPFGGAYYQKVNKGKQNWGLMKSIKRMRTFEKV